jgi:hypothetical protein
MKIKYLILIGLATLLAGFFIGRATITSSITTKYVKGETVTNSVNVPTPYNVYIPAVPLLPTKPDTINNYIVLKVDTAKIISNYILRKRYKINAFDNSDGKLVLTPVVQYNNLDSLGIQFTPIIKTTTIIKERIITPFITVGYNTIGYFKGGGGIYYHNVGVSASYMYNLSNTAYEIGLYYKF